MRSAAAVVRDTLPPHYVLTDNHKVRKGAKETLLSFAPFLSFRGVLMCDAR